MKRVFVFQVVCLAVGTMLSASAFAQDVPTAVHPKDGVFSIGAGYFFSPEFNNWQVDEDVPGDLDRYDTTTSNMGGMIFLDAKYLQADVGLAFGSLGDKSGDAEAGANSPVDTLALKIDLFAKLPIKAMEQLTVFPMLGVTYDAYLSAERPDGRDAKYQVSDDTKDAKAMEALSSLWIKAGVGEDWYFTDNIFVRCELLYGIRFNNKAEKYQVDSKSDIDSLISHGLDVKVAFGWKL
jgi:hypothetical protein